MSQVEKLEAPGSQLGEGPLWHNERLYWVDIEGRQVHRLEISSGQMQSFVTPSRVGCIVPHRGGGLLMGLEDGLHHLDEQTGRIEKRLHIDLPDQRLNDGKADSRGRLWVGAMGLRGQKGQSRLYRIGPDYSIQAVLEGVTISNGLAWTADDRTLYYIDTPTRRIDAFDFDADAGTIANRRTAVEVPEGIGYPDGMTIDQSGNLWVGMWSGRAVACFDPRTGRMLRSIEVPGAENVTACTFGGPALDLLYITTARSDDQHRPKFPQGGQVFVTQPGVHGRATNVFG